jgi:serine/threonine-protein kinase
MGEGAVPFGRYKLLSLLGEGGMAKVYRAVLSGPMGFEKEVALKRLDPRLTADERMVKALINEARLGGQLRHRNIVEIYEFNHIDGNYFMAMEYVDGWTLDSILRRCRNRREPPPTSVVVEVLLAVCRGLSYAHTLKAREGHAMNLVHRDLKPGNIIISRAGDVKILDFGIAKSDANLYKTTAADVTKGTPIYMSPEQVTGARLDARSDLFSLGSILHELVTLDVPFAGDNLLAIMHAVLNADITEPRARVLKAAPALEPVLAKLMSKSPDQRFGSAAEVEAALKEAKRSVPPGPTLTEWIEEYATQLPQATSTGEFGPDGAPQPLVPAGTESLKKIEPLADDNWTWATRTETEMARSKGGVEPDGTAATIEAPSTPGRPGPQTADFFKTDGHRKRGESGATRARPSQKGRGRRKAAGGQRALLALVGVLGVVLVGLLIKVLEGPAEAEPTPVPANSAPPTPAPAAVEAATPAPVSPTPTPVAEPTPERVAAKSAKVPKIDPVRPATPQPTPAPVAEKPPPPEEVASAAGPGFLNVNSKPWSNLFLDGRFLGQTPKINFEVPSGPHKLEFNCGPCDPPQKKQYTFTLEPGGTFKMIHRFDVPE